MDYKVQEPCTRNSLEKQIRAGSLRALSYKPVHTEVHAEQWLLRQWLTCSDLHFKFIFASMWVNGLKAGAGNMETSVEATVTIQMRNDELI